MSFLYGKEECLITVEELDIIVEANIEKAVKEVQKLLPAVKKQLSGIQKEFNKVNIKDISVNIDISQVTKKIKQVKKQIKDMFNQNDVSNTKINGGIASTKENQKETLKLKGQKGISETVEPTIPEMSTNNIKSDIKPNILNDNIKNNQNINVKPTNDSISIWETLKQKIQQVKPNVEKFKQSLNSGEVNLNTNKITEAGIELKKLNDDKNKLEQRR